MEFVDYLIQTLVEEHNQKVKMNALGVTDDPDKDPDKKDRFQYGHFMIQPPEDYQKMNPKERFFIYQKINEFIQMLNQAVHLIYKRHLGDTFTMMRKPTGQLSVIRLLYDPKNEYAEMYQQDDPNNDGKWDAGDFLFNLGAKNNNIHTIIHALGHKHFYEVLSDKAAEEWKDYYEVRKYRDKRKNSQEFVTKYAAENHREDYAETYAVYVLGTEQVNSMYNEKRVNKDPECVQKIVRQFRNLALPKSKR